LTFYISKLLKQRLNWHETSLKGVEGAGFVKHLTQQINWKMSIVKTTWSL